MTDYELDRLFYKYEKEAHDLGLTAEQTSKYIDYCLSCKYHKQEYNNWETDEEKELLKQLLFT